MQLKDKYVLLTGASGGIGQAIALSLAKKGAKLLLVARHADRLKALIDTLPYPNEHQYLCAALTTPEGMTLLRNKSIEYLQHNNKFSVVINNAGTNQFRFLAQRDQAS
ncbi:hypothetical protein AKJ18_25840, partial [Vibrio xuii]